ncbi:hypothetical protein QJQ45_013854 [Haematococcus lacustris]|nr:hypothetical protein QJQ45_013854 [Haematococcus lacustris]
MVMRARSPSPSPSPKSSPSPPTPLLPSAAPAASPLLALATLHHGAVYQQGLALMLDHVVAPALAGMQGLLQQQQLAVQQLTRSNALLRSALSQRLQQTPGPGALPGQGTPQPTAAAAAAAVTSLDLLGDLQLSGPEQQPQQAQGWVHRSPPRAKAKAKARLPKPNQHHSQAGGRDCNAAVNMQRDGESKRRPAGAVPVAGLDWPGLGYMRLGDRARSTSARSGRARAAAPGSALIHYTQLQLDTQPGVSLHDITPLIVQELSGTGLREGLATVLSRHTTTAVTINEFEPRLLDDVRQFVRKLAPPQDPYLHNDLHLRAAPPDWPGGHAAWAAQEPVNAHSHLLSMVLGNSQSIPVVEGKLALGTWQSVILVELDGPRTRSVGLQLMGSVGGGSGP